MTKSGMGNESGNGPIRFVGYDESCCGERQMDLLYYGEHYHLTNQDGSYGPRLDPRLVGASRGDS
jgi:hypothetical protein